MNDNKDGLVQQGQPVLFQKNRIGDVMRTPET